MSRSAVAVPSGPGSSSTTRRSPGPISTERRSDRAVATNVSGPGPPMRSSTPANETRSPPNRSNSPPARLPVKRTVPPDAGITSASTPAPPSYLTSNPRSSLISNESLPSLPVMTMPETSEAARVSSGPSPSNVMAMLAPLDRTHARPVNDTFQSPTFGALDVATGTATGSLGTGGGVGGATGGGGAAAADACGASGAFGSAEPVASPGAVGTTGGSGDAGTSDASTPPGSSESSSATCSTGGDPGSKPGSGASLTVGRDVGVLGRDVAIPGHRLHGRWRLWRLVRLRRRLLAEQQQHGACCSGRKHAFGGRPQSLPTSPIDAADRPRTRRRRRGTTETTTARTASARTTDITDTFAAATAASAHVRPASASSRV